MDAADDKQVAAAVKQPPLGTIAASTCYATMRHTAVARRGRHAARGMGQVLPDDVDGLRSLPAEVLPLMAARRSGSVVNIASPKESSVPVRRRRTGMSMHWSATRAWRTTAA